jgi:hypothetical protein
LRDWCILIQNSPQREFDWSLDTLKELGTLDQSRDIQGMVFSSKIRAMPHVSYLSGSIPRGGEGARHAQSWHTQGTLHVCFRTCLELPQPPDVIPPDCPHAGTKVHFCVHSKLHWLTHSR